MPGFIQVPRDAIDQLFHKPLALRLLILITQNARYGDEPINMGGVEVGKGQWLRSIRNLCQDMSYVCERGAVRVPAKSTIEANLKLLNGLNYIQIYRTRNGHLITLNLEQNSSDKIIYETANGHQTDKTEERERKRKKKNNTKTNIKFSKGECEGDEKTKPGVKLKPGQRPNTLEIREGIFLTKDEIETIKLEWGKGEGTYWADKIHYWATEENPAKFKRRKNHFKTISKWRNTKLEDCYRWCEEENSYRKSWYVEQKEAEMLKRANEPKSAACHQPINPPKPKPEEKPISDEQRKVLGEQFSAALRSVGL